MMNIWDMLWLRQYLQQYWWERQCDKERNRRLRQCDGAGGLR